MMLKSLGKVEKTENKKPKQEKAVFKVEYRYIVVIPAMSE